MILIIKNKGKRHFYIPDFFIPSLQLEIEIKDGGDNPNMHHKIQDVDKVKEKLKDDVMKSNQFNYLKITNKDNKKFLDYLILAKEQNEDKNEKPIFMVESEEDDTPRGMAATIIYEAVYDKEEIENE